MMNAEVKQKWVAALRSGDYPQARGTLHRLRDVKSFNLDAEPTISKAGYCCLGVLCSVLELKQHVNPLIPTATFQYADIICLTELPKKLEEDLNMDSEETAYLIHLNDILKLDFEEIADYIERKL